MSSQPLTVPPSLFIEQLVQDYIYRHHFKMFPVVEDSRLLGCITTREVKAVPQELWANRTVGEFTIPCSEANTVSPDTDAMQVLSLMTQSGASSRFMVVEDQQLLGIISLTDLKEFLSLKLDLESPKR